MKERVAIFIDGSNLHWSVKRAFHKSDHHLDFEKLVFELSKGKELVGTWYVNGELDKEYREDTYLEQKQIMKNMERIDNFHTHLCRMVKRGEEGIYEYTIKGDDVWLSVKMVSLAYEDKYDTAILMTGDDDFGPAADQVKSLSKKVINAHFSVNQSDHLKRDCTDSVNIENIIGKCLR